MHLTLSKLVVLDLHIFQNLRESYWFFNEPSHSTIRRWSLDFFIKIKTFQAEWYYSYLVFMCSHVHLYLEEHPLNPFFDKSLSNYSCSKGWASVNNLLITRADLMDLHWIVKFFLNTTLLQKVIKAYMFLMKTEQPSYLITILKLKISKWIHFLKQRLLKYLKWIISFLTTAYNMRLMLT